MFRMVTVMIGVFLLFSYPYLQLNLPYHSQTLPFIWGIDQEEGCIPQEEVIRLFKIYPEL